MEKLFRLNESPYHKINAIRVSVHYDKRAGGYAVQAELLHYYFDGNLKGLFSKCFCPEYYNHDGDGISKVFEAGRRSAKKEAEAAAYCEANAADIAQRFLQHVISKLGIEKDIHIIGEAEA